MSQYQRPNRVTATSIEKTIKQQRDLEDTKRNLQQFGIESAKLLSAAQFQTKVESKRAQAEKDLLINERLKQEQSLELEKSKRRNEQITAQKNAITIQLENDYSQQERERIEIQRICDESPELKELEQVLKIAYLNKDRAIQQQEKLLLATKEKQRILAIENDIEIQRQHAIQNDQVKLNQQKVLYTEQRRILQQQIDDKKSLILESQKQAEIDREAVNKIVQQINEEDENDYKRRKEIQIQTAKMIADFEQQRKIEKETAKAREREEENKIKQYQDHIASRQEGVLAIKQQKQAEDTRIFQQIVEETERKRRQEEEYNNLRDLLWEEELEQKRKQDAYNRHQKSEFQKKQMFDMNKRLIDMKAQHRYKEAEDEMRLIEVGICMYIYSACLYSVYTCIACSVYSLSCMCTILCHTLVYACLIRMYAYTHMQYVYDILYYICTYPYITRKRSYPYAMHIILYITYTCILRFT